MVKAVFFDIDGTLVSFKTHRVSARTAEALRTLREKGIRTFIATGRHYTDLSNVGALPFDGYVTLNGQYCYNDAGVIYKRGIDAEDIRATVAMIEADPFPCMFIEQQRMYVNMIDDRVRAALRLLNLPDPPVEDVRTALGTDIYQMMPFIGPERGQRLMAGLSRCGSTRWNDYFMDVVPEGGSKRVGIDAMIAAYGIALDETMAFGDGQNDVEMLSHVAFGIAMGNAAPEVKAAAGYVTTGVDSEGVSRALKKFGLI